MMKFPITECPYCGCKLFFNKEKFSGSSEIVYDSNGKFNESGYNDSMYEGITSKRQNTFYCRDCERRLFTLSEIEMNK